MAGTRVGELRGSEPESASVVLVVSIEGGRECLGSRGCKGNVDKLFLGARAGDRPGSWLESNTSGQERPTRLKREAAEAGGGAGSGRPVKDTVRF